MSSQASPTRKESSEIGRGVLEMSSSLPSSSSGKFSSANEDPSTAIQVIISPDPYQSHAHTPFIDTSTAASLQNENIGVNKKTPPIDLDSLKGELYRFALKDNWEGAKSIFDDFPHMIPMELTVNGDTALHVAARSNKITFVQGLVKRNKNLPLIRGHDNMLPVHLAALNGHREIVQDLSTEDQLEKMAPEDIELLFLTTVSSSLYDVATKLLEKYPDRLVIARDDQKQTALHILARKPSQKFAILYRLYMTNRLHWLLDMKDDNNEEASSGLGDKLQLLKKLSYHVRRLECKTALDLTTKPSKVLFDAVKSGNIHTVKCLLDEIPGLLDQKESNGQNILHIAALYRQQSIFEFLLQMRTASLVLEREVDKDWNNVLHHFAAQLSEERSSSNLRPNILLAGDGDLKTWLEEVLKLRVPAPQLGTMRNNKGQTPQDIFSAHHEELLKGAKETVKGIAEPCMLVATLIATIAFPAALTVPGGDSTNPWFMPFFFANAAALFASSSSILIFLTIYTSSWLNENESFIWQNARLALGLRFLNISVDAMIIALILASWMIFQQYWAREVVLALSLPAFAALFYLQYATLRHALQTLMATVGKIDIQKLKNFILPT